MLTKFGLILLIATFGALSFVLGVLAPDSVRQPVLAVARHTETSDSVTRAASKPLVSAKSAETATVPYRDLLIPTPLPADGIYALQVGLHSTRADADVMVRRAQEVGFEASAIPIADESGTRWVAVAVGHYGTPDDARAARLNVTRALALSAGVPVIRLPASHTPAP